MHVISVYGPFADRALVEMTTTQARDLLGDEPLASAQPAHLIDAVERDLADIRKRSPAVADSALAALIVTLAYELANPFNSATSKGNCAGQMRDALKEMRELAPPEKEKDGVDEIAEQRARRRAGSATAKG